ncbi:unnamed protein product [Urochloa decumbens]|uniref:DUF4220 domain-containing protein n=1 Tax=Urochloa decumbens TaxID=240449 RepID=A0ABC8Z7T0_9POAL
MSNPLSVPSENLANGGIVGAAVLANLMVALSTLGRHCFRHPAFRLLVWGASTVFLPLTSSIITSLLKRSTEAKCDASSQCTEPRKGKANPDIQNMWTLLLWVVLILTIKCNADVAAAAVTVAAASPSGGDASVDGQRVRPPVDHLAMYAWCGYLIWLCVPLAGWLGNFNKTVFVAFSVLGLVKLGLNLAAFWSASGSFALGKNARLVAGYMAQLVSGGAGGQVPRYIVMGEAKRHVEESAEGYRIKRDVLDDRDLCLSYSLFKLLRRRLSGYPLADAGSGEALDFVLGGMGGAGGDADRVFRVLVDELWFVSDFYYSPIPLCIFGGWLAALNYLCSLSWSSRHGRSSPDSSYGRMDDKGSAPAAARRVVGGKVDWALHGGQKSWAWDGDVTSNTEQILVWHVATRLFEMKSTSASPDMSAASHLSNYFAYLVAAAPELLPDSAEWSKKRYEEVSEDARAALLGADGGNESAEARYEQMTKALSGASRDKVLRRGAELGRHLVAQYGGEDEASACRILADFWSEMALYVAPSENVKGHVQAMARGGEFITLVWALLLHAGVTTRPDTPAAGAAIP